MMHIEKIVCDNILKILFHILGKMKDHKKAHFNSRDIGIKKKLYSIDSIIYVKACYYLTKGEKDAFY